MKNVKIIPENISLFHLNIVESKVIDTLRDKNISFNVNVAHTTMHNLQDQKVKIGLLIDIQGQTSNDKNIAKAHFNIDFHYQIVDLDHYYKIDKNEEIKFAGSFISILLGISFSTARGLIYEHLSNTNLSGLILPIISPGKMLQTKISSIDS